ncbi:MAG: COG4705 family protein [Solirubrobacteraceae bacterium]
MRETSHPRLRAALPLAVKVPEITLIFWLLKLLTTGMGEAMSDFMGQHSVPIAGAVGIFGLAFALWLQFRTPEYRAPVYWFAVMMVAVFGTMAADGIHDGASIPYSVTTPVFAAVVAVTFGVWYRSEGTLSIHSINTRRREAFYWTAVLGTFALGTAAGDLTAYSLNLGFWASAGLFAVVFALPAIGWWRLNLNPIVAFWAAYVVTRPLGASFADGFSKPTNGGLSWGDGTVSAIALVAFIALVTYVSVTKRDVQRRRSTRGGREPSLHVPHPHLERGPQPQTAES